MRPMRLSPVIAARIASDELGCRIPPATVRSWRHRGLVAGGKGWVDGEDLADFLQKRIPQRKPRWTDRYPAKSTRSTTARRSVAS